MQNVVEIKYIRVKWSRATVPPRPSAPGRPASQYLTPPPGWQVDVGLDLALSELATKVTAHLKAGWVVRGDITYPEYEVVGGDGAGTHKYLLQTLVKYEKNETLASASAALKEQITAAVSATEAAVAQGEERATQAEKEVATLTAEVSSLKDALAQGEERTTQAEAEVAALSAEVSGLKDALAQHFTELRRARGRWCGSVDDDE